jgi:hypothetical protein
VSSTSKPNSGSTCPRKSRTSMRNDEAMSHSIACTSCKVVNDRAAFCALPVCFLILKTGSGIGLRHWFDCLKPIFLCVRLEQRWPASCVPDARSVGLFSAVREGAPEPSKVPDREFRATSRLLITGRYYKRAQETLPTLGRCDGIV